MTDLREKLDNFRSWANIPGDPIREPRRSYINRYHSALAKAWESGALVPAPAVSDDVATWRQRADGFAKSNQTLRCDLTEAQRTIETQAAELARKDAALRKLSTAACFGNGEVLGRDLRKDPFGREILARMNIAEAALTHPTGAPK